MQINLVHYLFVISTSVIDCLGRFVPEMTYYLSSGMLNLAQLNPTQLYYTALFTNFLDEFYFFYITWSKIPVYVDLVWRGNSNGDRSDVRVDCALWYWYAVSAITTVFTIPNYVCKIILNVDWFLVQVILSFVLLALQVCVYTASKKAGQVYTTVKMYEWCDWLLAMSHW